MSLLVLVVGWGMGMCRVGWKGQGRAGQTDG